MQPTPEIAPTPTLSLVMIVKDEAHCLADCLASVRDIADQLVVADTGSTDGTKDIARRFNALVLDVEWHEDFAEARNRALAAATGDWILHLDADEVLDPAGARRIRELVHADGLCLAGSGVGPTSRWDVRAGARTYSSADDPGVPADDPGVRADDPGVRADDPGVPADDPGVRADAIEVTLANYCDDPRAWRWTPAAPDDPMARGFSGYIQVGLLRLFRNHCGFEYREPVHENITESVVERGGVIRREPIVIHHYGHGAQGRNAAAKGRLYLDIARRKTSQRPADPKAWHDFAEQSLACGDAETAESACRKALWLDPRHLGAATSLANILLNRGDLDEARLLLEGLESSGILPPHVGTALGAIAYKQGRLDEAQRRLESVLATAPRAVMACLYLSRVLDLLGNAAGARSRIEEAVAVAPGLPEFQNRLEAHRLRREGEDLARENRVQPALSALVEALRLDPEDPVTQNDLGVVLAGMGETSRARECFDRARRLVFNMPEAAENLRALERRTTRDH